MFQRNICAYLMYSVGLGRNNILSEKYLIKQCMLKILYANNTFKYVI